MIEEIYKFADAHQWFTSADVLKEYPELNRAGLTTSLKRLTDSGVLERVPRSGLCKGRSRFIYRRCRQ